MSPGDTLDTLGVPRGEPDELSQALAKEPLGLDKGSKTQPGRGTPEVFCSASS